MQGYVFDEFGDVCRIVVFAKDIFWIVKLVVLVVEDADFYEHDGFDYLGMVWVMYKNICD